MQAPLLSSIVIVLRVRKVGVAAGGAVGRGEDKMQRINRRAMADGSQRIKDSPKEVNSEADRQRANEEDQ
jgi:hypothetical protein